MNAMKDMNRRTFVQGAVAAAVAAAVPWGERAHRCHEWSVQSEMCLTCRMTRKMVEDTGRIECPGTALYDYKTYRTKYLSRNEWQPMGYNEMSAQYAEALAQAMRLTKEVAAANVLNGVFS